MLYPTKIQCVVYLNQLCSALAIHLNTRKVTVLKPPLADNRQFTPEDLISIDILGAELIIDVTLNRMHALLAIQQQSIIRMRFIGIVHDIDHETPDGCPPPNTID